VAGHEQFNHHDDEIRRQRTDIEDKQKKYQEQDISALTENDRKHRRTALHVAAAGGDLQAVKRVLYIVIDEMGFGVDGDGNGSILHARDVNEWQAIHEAARGGHLDVLKYLVDRGANLTAKTEGGGTPLWWARSSLRPDHPVVEYLKEIGAPDKEAAPLTALRPATIPPKLKITTKEKKA
jgi:Ankyrin repeats (3 copies)